MSDLIIRTLPDMRVRTAAWKAAGDRIGIVPTMGALHQGHLSLVEAAKKTCDRVVVWIFVNPKQFNNASDLENYPRTEHDDAVKLAPYDVDTIYVPDVDQVYPNGFATNVSVSGLTDVLCGADRPGHFDGVATVVSKIFLQTGADEAFFGEKDFQQLQVVRRMAADLDIPITVTACPTVREPSGLALSSRNLRLSVDGAKRATAIIDTLQGMAAALRDGAAMDDLTGPARDQLSQAGFTDIAYLELRAEDDLSLLDRPSRPARLFAAAWLEDVRLIDNIPV